MSTQNSPTNQFRKKSKLSKVSRRLHWFLFEDPRSIITVLKRHHWRKLTILQIFDNWKHRRSGTARHILTCQLDHRSQKTFEAIIWDVTETCRNTTLAVNQTLVQKTQNKKSTSYSVILEKVMSIVSFRVTPFCCSKFQKFSQ